jgi:glutamine synthetase
LDDKTLFRKAEIKLEQASLTLLKQLGKKASAVKMALGLEQEFFIITKEAYQKRLDLRNTGRTLIGKLPPKHQQFSDHYYGKIPMKIE